MSRYLAVTACALVLCASAGAGADTTSPVLGPGDDGSLAYALVVGNNPGGAGQETLRYAEADARRMAGLLRELGGYEASHVRVLLRPSAAELLSALDGIAAELTAEAGRGNQTKFFFYYSGHARASALNLGAEELPLGRLRDKLLGLPTDLTVVVLDACQSGAFSRIKGGGGGAEPAADFSYSSVSRLNATGVVVMASSSGTELSQESGRLGSSYFTHHLLVALRGAGDANRDGRVSLDEAYRYAYQATLVSTAATKVGTQHVTLETDLKGKGDVALSYPARAQAHLELPAPLAAEILVRIQPQGAVVAEIHKSKGAAVRLALPEGRYEVLVRAGGQLEQCSVSLRDHRVTMLAVDREHCERTLLIDGTAKSGHVDSTYRYGIEMAAGLSGSIQDRYIERLTEFGFHDQTLVQSHLRLALTYRVRQSIDMVLDLSNMDTEHYRRDNDEGPHDFTWHTVTMGLYFRGSVVLAHGLLMPFVQAGGGLGRGKTTYDAAMSGTDAESFWGYHLGAAAGLELMPWQRFGFVGRMGYDYAPIIDNLLGDTHDSGGLTLSLGARVAL